ncbi:phage/plasmid primase, P4 family [Actinomadura rudentiformis]|uniref:SF3 helicase domain-containing protein n=1 Tax=Actinomadura rudentiformis TaxID=359158 RepID=A0A6H9YQA5_9ACTN|nr:phage/plasmid primase, P4 family [Actinomadura rudentiformis]KAB2347318.1 hypothetical protein F8566_20110 [Actinomadura rudentiformis]
MHDEPAAPPAQQAPQPQTILDAALAFHAAGCSVVPARTDGSKSPAAFWKLHQEIRADTTQIQRWFTLSDLDGFGVITGQISAPEGAYLELLELEGRAVREGLIEAYHQHLADHGLTDLWHRITSGYLEATPSGGLHILYRVKTDERRGNTKLARRPATPEELAAWKAQQQTEIDAEQDENKKAKRQAALDRITEGHQVPQVLIETRGEGGFTVTAPSAGRTHPSGKPWALLGGGPASIADISEEERDALHAIASLLDVMPAPTAPAARPSARPSRTNEAGRRPGDEFNEKASWAEILEPHGWRRTRSYGDAIGWCRPGKSGHHVSATTGRNAADNLYVFSSSTVFETEKVYSKFEAWTLLEHGGDFSAAARELAARGYGDPPPRGDEGLHELIADYEPSRHGPFGPDNPRPGIAGGVDGNLATVHQLNPDEQPRLQVVEERTHQFSDDRNALALVERFGEQIRYCPDRGRWLHWTDTQWKWCEQGGGIVREFARRIARSLPTENLVQQRFKQSSLSARGINAAVLLAQTDERVVVPITDLDAHPFDLNTPNGVVNLETGDIKPCMPERMHTRLAAATPNSDMPTPLWDRFLADTFGGDTEMIAFVQRLAGYSASADVRHHLLPFPHGGGQNGKSVLMDVLRALLGDYATTAPPGFLMEGKHEHSAEVARLQGVRLVVASEVNQNSRFDEAKLKELTGGDTLTARFMRQDFFTFQPTHHLWLMANHKPQVKAGGDSFWRRLRLIPFNYRVPDDKKIENLAGLLVSEEGPGILAWMVAGAVDVFSGGLREPESVMAETRAYAAEEDQLGRFLEERCHVGGGQQVRVESRLLRASYEQWCHTEGEQALSSSPLGRELKLRGIDLVKSNGKRFYTNVGLLRTDDDDRWDER